MLGLLDSLSLSACSTPVPENHQRKHSSISVKLGTPQSFISGTRKTGVTKLENHLFQTDPRQ